MATQSLILKSVADSTVELRTIHQIDNENLREWKNANRFSFFFQDIITPEMQTEWFQKYLARANDFMFIVAYRDQSIGCMGFRMLDHHADIYNVILGRSELGGKGIMGQALQLMCSFIYAKFTREIGLQVLKTNPAVDWYLKNNFIEIADRESHFVLALDLTRFQPHPFKRVDLLHPQPR